MIKINQHLEPKQIITADLYKGSIIEKAFQGGDEGTISAEIIRVQLNNKLEKGIISEELHDKAMEQLDSLVKAGEGSRGGKVVGHTKSGKPIYATKYTTGDKLIVSDKGHKWYGKAVHVHSVSEAKDKGQLKQHSYLVGLGKEGGSAEAVGESQLSFGKERKDKSGELKKAYDILGIQYTESNGDTLEKASKGEGSKGGHVIGHTKSGKPVYAGKKASENKDFTAQDHKDASDLHSKQSSDHRAKVTHPHNTTLADHHHQVSNAHQQEAAKQIQSEHESSLSGDEKKIIADQKKKQIDHHETSHKFHSEIADHIKEKYGKDGKYASSYELHSKEAAHHKSEKEKLEGKESSLYGSSHHDSYQKPKSDDWRNTSGVPKKG